MSRRPKPLAYSELDTARCDAYRLRFQVQEWACIAELIEDAPSDVDDTAREVIGGWAAAISAAYDLTPRRVVAFETPAKWADFLWYVLTLPAAAELEDIGRSMRRQVMRANREAKARAKRRMWDSLRGR